MLAITTKTDDGFCIQGAVSFLNAIALRSQSEPFLANLSLLEYVVDLSLMRDQDASPISLLLCLMRLAEKNGKKIRFVNASSSLVRMQKLFGLEKIMQLTRNE